MPRKKPPVVSQASQNVRPRAVRIAVVQLEGNISVTVGNVDYMVEPIPPGKGTPILAQLLKMSETNDAVHLREIFLAQYVSWAIHRLKRIFEFLHSLSNDVKPDIIIFPEFSIPFELLPTIAEYCQKGRYVIVAGNHAFNRSLEEYRSMLKSCDLILPSDQAINPPFGGAGNSMLGVFLPGDQRSTAIFRFKHILSPFEFSDLFAEVGMRQPSSTDLKGSEIVIPHLGFSMQVLICAEALQGVSPLPDPPLTIVCACHTKPEDFDRFLTQKSSLLGVGVLASDGQYGGSYVAVNRDIRAPSWWNSFPQDGRLPKGSGILIHEVFLTISPNRSGMVNPQKPERLIMCAPITCGDEGEDEFKVARFLEGEILHLRAARNMADSVGPTFAELQKSFAAKVRSVIGQYKKISPLQKLQCSILMALAEVGTMDETVLDALGHSCMVSSNPTKPGGKSSDSGEFVRKSLAGIRRQMAFDTYSWLRHKLEVGNLPPNIQSKCVAMESACLEFSNPGSGADLTAQVSNFIIGKKRESKEIALSNLNALLGTLIENYSASSGYIVAAKGGSNPVRFREIVSHNINSNLAEMLAPGPQDSVPLRCFCQASPILEQTITRANPHWKGRVLPTTESFVASPIFSPGTGSVIGVVVLESRDRHTFVLPQQDELIADCTRATLDLLVLDSVGASEIFIGWHPDGRGEWDLTVPLHSLCKIVATSLPGTKAFQSLCCTIWNVDWYKRFLYVTSTVGFNFEYIANRLLPLRTGNAIDGDLDIRCPLHPDSWVGSATSFTASVACTDNDRNKVYRSNISSMQGYHRKEKATRMGLSYVISCPIFDPDPQDPERNPKEIAAGVVSFYFYERHRPEFDFSIAGVFSNYNVSWLADVIGGSYSKMAILKGELAIAKLHSRLSLGGISCRASTEILINTIKEIIGCNAATILCTELDAVELSLGGPRILFGSDLSNPQPDLEYGLESAATLGESGCVTVSGITGFLARCPGSLVRKIDVADRFEGGALIAQQSLLDRYLSASTNSSIQNIQIGSVFFAPNNRMMERSDSPLDHRRFLGLSAKVADDHGDKMIVVIVRLIRNSGSRPFTHLDGLLLKTLIAYQSTELAIHYDQETAKASALAHQRPLTGKQELPAWRRHFLLSLLQSSIVECQTVGSEFGIEIVSSALRFEYKGDHGDRKLRVYASESTLAAKEVHVDCSYDRSIKAGCIEEVCLDNDLIAAIFGPKPKGDRRFEGFPPDCSVVDILLPFPWKVKADGAWLLSVRGYVKQSGENASQGVATTEKMVPFLEAIVALFAKNRYIHRICGIEISEKVYPRIDDVSGGTRKFERVYYAVDKDNIPAREDCEDLRCVTVSCSNLDG